MNKSILLGLVLIFLVPLVYASPFYSYQDDFTGGFDGNITINTMSGSGNGCYAANNRMESVSMAGYEYCYTNITKEPNLEGGTIDSEGYVEANFTFNLVSSSNDVHVLAGISNMTLSDAGDADKIRSSSQSFIVHYDNRRTQLRYCNDGSCSSIGYTGTQIGAGTTYYGQMLLNKTHFRFIYDTASDYSSPEETFITTHNENITWFNHIILLGDDDINNGHNMTLDDLSIYATTRRTIFLEYPADGLNVNTVSLDHNYTLNIEQNPDVCRLYTNETGTWSIEEITTTPTNNQLKNLTHTYSEEGEYIWNIGCNTTTDSNFIFAQSNYTLTIDQTDPIILPEPKLAGNNSIVANRTLQTQINFTDETEIYSINVTFGNGTVIFNDTNMGITRYDLTIDALTGTNNNITARVCDAHTAQEIKTIKTKKEDKGLKFVTKSSFFVDREWVKVYPEDSSIYNSPTTTKLRDRYPFTFEKKSRPNTEESFIVESSHKIDIAKKQLYGGHVIIPAIGDNGYWVDFDNKEATDYTIERISDYKVRIKVKGLTSNKMTFNSIGELNCVEANYTFHNLNPVISYTTPVLIGQETTTGISIIDVANATINATAYYNNTFIGTDTTVNFTQIITAPSISVNSTNVPLYWILSVESINYTLETVYQNVSNVYLDNCSIYDTLALNISLYDEENESITTGDIDAEFVYDVNNIAKSSSISVTDISSLPICIFPNYINLTTNYTLFYSDTSYPQRRYYRSNHVLNNITQDLPLYLLDATKGVYFYINVEDGFGNPIEGVTITAQKTIDSVLTTIEREETDGAGLATFWLDPDSDYLFTATKKGYPQFSTTLRPTYAEPYTISLGSQQIAYNESYGLGVGYNFRPVGDLVNNTEYTFTFNLTSSYWVITDCDFTLTNGSTTLTTVAGTYSDSLCTASITYNTTTAPRIVAQGTYKLNDSTTLTQYKEYAVRNFFEGQFSLKSFIDDLRTFSYNGFNNFTRLMITFIVISLVLMILSINGVRDPLPLVIILMILTWFAGYTGWLYIDYNAPAIFGQAAIAVFLQNYILAIIISLAGGAYILREINT